MLMVESDRVRLHYEISGRADAPILVLVNSLGSDMHTWERVLPVLEGRFRVLRSDMRGHGRSEVAAESFTIEQLGRDVLSMMDEVHAERASICGVSLGGLVGLWLGIHAPDRVDRLILANTAATDPRGYTACCAVLRDADLRGGPAQVKAACLVITGTHDPATPPADGRALHAAIQHSSYVELHASHMSAWEYADVFARTVVEHVTTTEVTHG